MSDPARAATSDPVHARRFLALHLPWFATDRLARIRPELRDGPCATWEAAGSARLLASVCQVAERAGLRVGMPLADATAMLPHLQAIPRDAQRERAALDGLAAWCLRFTPLAATAPPEGLVLDSTGCGHLWGGEEALARDACARLGRAGYAATFGLASTALAALVLARAGGGVAAHGAEAKAIGTLPLGLLRLEARVEESLARLGIRRIGELARQPRAPLARRIGAASLARLDEALGLLSRPIVPVRPPPPAQVARDFAEPLISAEPIEHALGGLVERLVGELAARGEGARRVELSCFRVDGTVQRLGLGTARAARDPAHLMRLFDEQRAAIEPRFGIERMALAATLVEPLHEEQRELSGGRAARREELARLVDRLSLRLRVRRLAPVLSHWPERAVRGAPPLAPVPVPSGWGARVRPVRLVHPPEPLRVEGERLVWRGAMVALREGPERLEPEWWRGSGEAARDYWRAEVEGGARLWVFRTHEEPARWYLHGHLK